MQYLARLFELVVAQRYLPRLMILCIDLLITLFAIFLMLMVRYGLKAFSPGLGMLEGGGVMLLLVCNVLAFSFFRTHRGVLRFSTFSDLLRIVYALTAGYSLTFFLGATLLSRFLTVAGIIFFSTYVLNAMLMIFLRIMVKEFYEAMVGLHKAPTPVFIYGTRETGITLAKSLKGNKEVNFKVLGFISDERHMVGKELIGVRVYAVNNNLFRVLLAREVSTIIVSPQKMEELKHSDSLNAFIDRGFLLLTTGPIGEWNGKTLRRDQFKDIEIEDLMPRDTIHINTQHIAAQIEGKRILVTGAAGSIGSELVRQIAIYNPYSVTLIDQAETPLHNLRLELQESWREMNAATYVADVANASRMDQIFARVRPQYLFHAAAYKHVPMMEDNVSESVQTNIRGTKIVADLAVKYGVEKFVMISTDKAVNPSNVMGCSKRICEIYVQSLARDLEARGVVKTQFITTRFGNVLGSNGSVIPRFREQIRRGGPVTVTHPEVVRFFMTIPEACQLVLEAGSMGRGGEIFLFDMGKPVKIVDLAKRMILLSGTPHIKIEYTGLRHGEKLYEELLNISENTLPTHHPKILIAKVRQYNYSDMNRAIEALIATSFAYNDTETVRQMKSLVPEFQSINSPFEPLNIPLRAQSVIVG